jgi:hypothetical protein
LAVFAAACTDATLFRAAGESSGPVDNKLSIQSSFCTDDPSELKFPVKVVFIVDTSQSLNVTDPTGQRLTAVKQVVDAFLPDPGVSFAIIQFNGNTNTLTDSRSATTAFTRNQTKLYNAIAQLGIAGGNTNYESALSNTFRVLSQDMMQQTDLELSRSKYVLIFISDGLPFPVDPPRNTRTNILQRVSDIMALIKIYRPRELKLHTALLLGPMTGGGSRCTDSMLEGGDMGCMSASTVGDCAMMGGNCTWIGADQEASSLLEAMANAGKGTFRSFPNGEQINFLKIDFTTIRRIFTLKNLIVSNASARPKLDFFGAKDRIGRGIPDTDGDGLSDDEEKQLGTNPFLIDTDGDGFNDLLEVRLSSSGFDPLDPSDADCTLPLDRQDTDGDGLLDCEERFVGTSKTLMDSDGDGIPDLVELRFNTNPSADDSLDDLDFDGARNGDETRGHTDPLVNDAATRSAIAYRYDLVNTGLTMDGRTCYNFRVDNITLAGTLKTGENRVMVFIDEAPFDDPKDLGTYRVGCVKQKFVYPDLRDPPYPVVQMPSDAFKKPTDFNIDRDCITGTPALTSTAAGVMP